jgi:hypothetical protein
MLRVAGQVGWAADLLPSPLTLVALIGAAIFLLMVKSVLDS